MTFPVISFMLFPGQSSFQETLCYQKPVVAIPVTGKSLSEALILTSTNPQYDKRGFIDLPVPYMKTTSSEHGENTLCTQIVFCFDIQNNLCTQQVLPMF